MIQYLIVIWIIVFGVPFLLFTLLNLWKLSLEGSTFKELYYAWDNELVNQRDVTPKKIRDKMKGALDVQTNTKLSTEKNYKDSV